MTDNVQPVEQWMTHGLATGETAVMLKRELPNPFIVPAFLIVARCSVKSDAEQIVSDHNRIAVLEQALRDIAERVLPYQADNTALRSAYRIARDALGEGKETT